MIKAPEVSGSTLYPEEDVGCADATGCGISGSGSVGAIGSGRPRGSDGSGDGSGDRPPNPGLDGSRGGKGDGGGPDGNPDGSGGVSGSSGEMGTRKLQSSGPSGPQT